MSATTTRGTQCGNCKQYHSGAAEVKACYMGQTETDQVFDSIAATLPAAMRQEPTATEPQMNFLRTLLADRDHDFDVEPLLEGLATSKAAASEMITTLKGMPKKSGGRLATAGKLGYDAQKGDVHVVDGSYYRVHKAQHSDRLYVCKWDGERFDYARGAMGLLSEATIATAEQAAAFGHMTEQCVFCSHPIDTPESVEVGYGPVCASRRGLPWG